MTLDQNKILAAVVERILPSEDGPGAMDANVMGFFEWAARQEFFRAQGKRVASGLQFIDSLAILRYGHGFAACSSSDRDALLVEIATVPHQAARQFFLTLIDLTLIGFLSDPKYGGNEHLVGWAHINFELRSPDLT